MDDAVGDAVGGGVGDAVDDGVGESLQKLLPSADASLTLSKNVVAVTPSVNGIDVTSMKPSSVGGPCTKG